MSDVNDDVLWHGFTITHVKDCIADPSKNRVVAEFSDDVLPVFPYLNAIISNLMYTPISYPNVRACKRTSTPRAAGAWQSCWVCK